MTSCYEVVKLTDKQLKDTFETFFKRKKLIPAKYSEYWSWEYTASIEVNRMLVPKTVKALRVEDVEDISLSPNGKVLSFNFRSLKLSIEKHFKWYSTKIKVNYDDFDPKDLYYLDCTEEAWARKHLDGHPDKDKLWEMLTQKRYIEEEDLSVDFQSLLGTFTLYQKG